MDSDKKKALELALGKIEKDFGKGSLMRLGDKPDEKIPVIPTGALSLDIALGIGGVPRGRIIEIYGAESSGKTTIALHIIAEAQFAVKINFYSRLLVLYFRRLVHDEVRRKIWRQPRQPEV